MADILIFDGITKSFSGVHALNGVSLAVRQGTLLGLIGENGAGKTTLMNILGGVVRPDGGTIRINGQAGVPRNPHEAARQGVAFIHQEINLFGNLTIAENIFLDRFPRLRGLPLIDKAQINRRAAELLASVDLAVSPRTRVEDLSPGEKQLVEIARALGADARIIIFDEPTTSLTARETVKLFDLIRRLKAGGVTIIYISHILGDIRDLSDDIAVLRDGRLVAAGPAGDFPVPRMISLMVGREISAIYPPRTARPGGEVLLSASAVSQTGMVRDITFELHRGEVLGLFGLMGSGRSELARMIFGVDSYESGRVTVLQRPLPGGSVRDAISRRMAFVTEDRRAEGLLMDSCIAENLGLASLRSFTRPAGVVDRRAMYAAGGQTATQLKLKSGPIQTATASSLSGGNQQKVVIGKWLMTHPEVLIMDEPTRGIDVGAKFEVYSLVNELAAKGAGVLFISSEIEELIGVCDTIMVMSRGELLARFPGPAYNRESIMAAAFRQTMEHATP